MNLVYIIFAFVVMGLCALGALFTALVVWRLTQKKPRAIRIGLLLLTPVPFFLLMSRCLGPSDTTDPAALAAEFEAEFGFLPPPDVRSMQARAHVIGDAYAHWLRFEASPETVDRIVSAKFTASTKIKFDEISTSPRTPPWWKPEHDQITVYYASEAWTGSNHPFATLGHDAAKRIVYFAHDAFD